MTRSICSRADLLRALEHHDPSIAAAMAALLGYHEMPAVEHEQPSIASPRASKSKTAAAQDTSYEPADVPFWRVEAYEAVTRDDTTSELLRTTPGTIPHWRKRPQQAPGFTPLAPRRTVLTRLRRVSAIRQATAEIDLEATVDLLSRGDWLRDVPHRYRRAWGADIYIVEDRARRLVPYWLDQEDVVDTLRHLYPPYGVTIARIGDGDSVPMVRWPEERRGQSGLPAPGRLVLVLGDLGCLATQGEHLQRFWVHWGGLLRDNGNPAVALVPMPLQDMPRELKRLWTVVRWDAAAASGGERGGLSTGDTVQRLLTLLSPAVRLEPGLLRAVRCLLPAGRRDAGLEARLWQDAAIVSQHSVAATLDPEWRRRALACFAAQPEHRLVLEQVRAWRAQVPEAVWFEEVLSLDPQVQHSAIEAADLEDAVRFLPALMATLQQAGQAATATEAWACRLLQRLPAMVWEDDEVGTAVHELYALVRPYLEAVPEGYDPAVLSPAGQPVRQVAVWQVADQMLFQVEEPAASGESHAVKHGSPLGLVHTASGEIKIAPGQWQRPRNEFWQGGQPPAWAQRWGDDAYGRWVTFRVQDVEQRLRWIPPGRFLMGSPAHEEGRYAAEGPQHDVQLTQGFWLFDTPCTQALWQAVMGENPSHFKDPQLPVEEVSWEDCQRFLAQLNTLLPGLDVRLPTEAQWEYACRAGTETARYHEDVDAIAWYEDNSNGETHEVGQKQPNAWGLYDMLGNVFEWCHDGKRRYTRSRVVDPVGPLGAAAYRALRGGCWLFSAQLVRAAYRDAGHPGDRYLVIGFRGASSGEASR